MGTSSYFGRAPPDGAGIAQKTLRFYWIEMVERRTTDPRWGIPISEAPLGGAGLHCRVIDLGQARPLYYPCANNAAVTALRALSDLRALDRGGAIRSQSRFIQARTLIDTQEGLPK